MVELIFLAILYGVFRFAVQAGKNKKTAQGQAGQSAPQPRKNSHPAFEDHYEPGVTEAEPQLSFEEMIRQAREAFAAEAKPDPQVPVSGSMAYDSYEGEGKIDGDYRLEEITPHSDDHVVKPLTETKHIHTESTIMGTAHCAPDKKDAYDIPKAAEKAPVTDIRKAMIWSEILGKPKALRR